MLEKVQEKTGRRKGWDMNLLYIDLFCGAGGTSTGVFESGAARVVACVNHDAGAIKSHEANHPGVLHFTEDIRTLNTAPMVSRLNEERKRNPEAKIVLWASCECTNFSNAKGGKPRDPDSRSLAEHLYRYITAIDPDYVQIENVVEFLDWGPLIEVNGKLTPDKKKKGESFNKWFHHIKEMGYFGEWRVLNAADFGAYTSRKRLFIQFAKEGLPITWPIPTHDRQSWKACREVLDLDNFGQSIFLRNKQLCDATLKRLTEGIRKFAAPQFVVRYMSGPGHVHDIDKPCVTITTEKNLYIATSRFITRYFSGAGHNTSIDNPCGTLTTVPHQYPVTVTFIDNYFGHGFSSSINDPIGTICTKEHRYPVTASFLANYYSGGGQLRSISSPSPSLTTVAKPRLVQCRFIDQTFGQSKPVGIEAPAPALLTNTHYNVITGLESPAPFISMENGKVIYDLYENDSESMVELKKTMMEYGIGNIYMRSLTIEESLELMGFPKHYKLIGTKTQQRKYIGNAVEVNMAKHLVLALANSIREEAKVA